MRIRIAAVLLCLALALTLAGCVHADRAVTLNTDGSGTYTFTIGLSDQLMSLSGGPLTKSMEDYGAQVERDGGTYTHYEDNDNGYSVWKYVRPFTSVSQLDTFLQQSPQTGSNTNGATPDTQNTVHVTEQPDFFSTTFHVTGHLGLVFPNIDQTTRDLLKDARESLAVTMPGWVSNQQGGNVNGNTVTYTVHLGESATIDVTGGGLNGSHVALILCGLLLALALFVVGLMLLRRGHRTPPKPVAYGSTSPYYMPTQPSGEATIPATPDYPPTPEPTIPE